MESSGQTCRQENIAERKEKQKLMGSGPCLEARKNSSEDGTRRDQRSEWKRSGRLFLARRVKTPKRQKYVSGGGREEILQIIVLNSWPLDHSLLLDGTVFLEGTPS